MDEKDKIMVSICCLTYNHSRFIQQCLEGILAQKCNFSFEVLIHDDASTDDTQLIIKTFEEKYPTIIKPIYQKENQYSKGIKPTLKYNFPRSKGKYIAICEGDDYWVDPYKLQKQVDFLENNPDYGLCFTKTKYFKNNVFEFQELPVDRLNGVYELKDLFFYYNFICTASVIFPIFDFPDWVSKLPYGDLAIYSILAKNKKIKCLDFYSSVYRIHDKGVWQGKSRIRQVELGLKFNKNIFDHVDESIQKIIRLKTIVLMEELIQLKFKNRITKGIYFRYLKFKFFPKQ